MVVTYYIKHFRTGTDQGSLNELPWADIQLINGKKELFEETI